LSSIVRQFDPVSSHEKVDFWLWPNVLSLDAPLVAVLWQLLLAQCMRVRLNPFEPFALGLAVWVIYIADHLIDTLRPKGGRWEPARKVFYRRHWNGTLALGIMVGCVLLGCVIRLLRAATLRGGLELSIAVLGYFSLIHLTPASWRKLWPREVAVAVLFTLGTFGAVWLGNGRQLVPLIAPAVIFTLLCWANCSLIEMAEWQASETKDAPNRVAQWAAGHLRIVAAGIALLASAFGVAFLVPGPFAIAGLLSGAALYVLAVNRKAISIDFISTAADLALCTPIALLLFPWAR